MIKYYLSNENGLEQLEEPASGCWISMIAPVEAEIDDISTRYHLDKDFLRAALDEDERSRIDTDDGLSMVLVNIPTVEEEERELYSTIPFSIILLSDTVITVCSEETPLVRLFEQGKVKDFRTNMKSRFVFQLLYRTDMLFLQYLRNIDKKSDQVEEQLHRSTENRDLIELLRLEKSLVYFSTALRSNEAVLEKLLRTDIIKKYPDDEELLADVIVENKQAIEMANIYSGILTGMMGTFASVISNNLGEVMQVLAVVTIVISIPTIIFSAYGMNVPGKGMPYGEHPLGFPIIIIFSVLLSILVAWIFKKIKWFK